MRLVRRSVAKDDPSAATRAVSRYGPYPPEPDRTWIRFADGRPVSAITRRSLSWCAEKLGAAGKRALLLIWGNAGEAWHVRREVRRWLGKHNRRDKESGEGVRNVSRLLPKRSPGLNAIEPEWDHGKRKVVLKPRVFWVPTSWPRGYAGYADVRITSTYPFHGRSPDHALGALLAARGRRRWRKLLVTA